MSKFYFEDDTPTLFDVQSEPKHLYVDNEHVLDYYIDQIYDGGCILHVVYFNEIWNKYGLKKEDDAMEDGDTYWHIRIYPDGWKLELEPELGR